MGLFAERRTERIDLGDGDWAEIYRSFPLKEGLMVERILRRLNENNLPEMAVELLTLGIAVWSGDAPIDAETVANLDLDKAGKIIDAFKATVGGEDPKASSSPSTSSARAKGRSRTPTP